MVSVFSVVVLFAFVAFRRVDWTILVIAIVYVAYLTFVGFVTFGW